MRERVYTRHGKKNVILVCPHGSDDAHTTTITKKAAETIDCWAVINQGFERNKHIDVDNDQADCNRIDQITQPVIFDEFLKPIISFRDRIKKKIFQKNGIAGSWFSHTGIPERILIFYIHGAGNTVHKIANEPVEVVVGYGLGNKKDSLTCSTWRKNCLVDVYRNIADDGEVFEANGGSKYAGRAANNLNQYFRKHDNDELVETMQLEYPFSARKTKKAAELTAAKLSLVIEEVLRHKKYDRIPHPKFI